ncbi:Similar to methyltransferase [Aspergillus niger CBS 513.88]; acc. no. XP_001401990 [Pyronema omphalodes CBS 100304]|uniref:Similar to methyltransferase [Aspergillus niger CBS 513.88] acc. no. XP_001401990 n=1 Tax=Pyronema omphalodes (strain CBS 100304) TaxID=1076935 RepID=U4LIT1_PYROM|nr:Similar to methyltransferase [Aspergillus niger CBS 513.88]; acc. no. XP_001401990 [Pyronema omphalodes CBS 100304]
MDRLNQQYTLIQTLTSNYLLHPNISRPTSPRIADIASGTGCWLIDLSSLYPDAVLHGFDIKIPLVPLPENVELTQHDVLDRFPEELRETYDMVHMRLMSAALTES